MALVYDYSKPKAACKRLGLVWLGDDYPLLVAADAQAARLSFTQEQVDAAMVSHLEQVAALFNPKFYRWYGRLLMALYFLTGWKPK